MKKILSCLALSAVFTLPGLAAARPVTLTTTLKNYGGDGAYLALYLTDASGAYVRTLWVAGKKSKYYKHLSDWYGATAGKASEINGITGANYMRIGMSAVRAPKSVNSHAIFQSLAAVQAATTNLNGATATQNAYGSAGSVSYADGSVIVLN